MSTGMSLVRTVADAVLYEGYLLYPYRASARKNQSRWQFGTLGPASAAPGIGEDPRMSSEFLVRQGRGGADASLVIVFRFLQLQSRAVEKHDGGGHYSPVPELDAAGTRWLSWDEAAEREISFGPFALYELAGSPGARTLRVDVAGGEDIENLTDADGEPVGQLVRRRRPLQAELAVEATPLGTSGLVRLKVALTNTTAVPVNDKHDADASSFLGAHLLLESEASGFVSLVDPPPDAAEAAAACAQHRLWPVLAGPEGRQDVLLLSPIILYDHPTVAPESSVALYDSTEIDEILTLRVLTMTEEEKAEARATDPKAAAVIDECEAMTPQQLEHLHGALRSPHPPESVTPPPVDAGEGLPWWDPAADESVHPGADSVLIAGVAISNGSRVRINPVRRADAQDLFFAGRAARVTGVLSDVDGSTHVAVVLEDDPAADLHDWFGRYLYFAPEELEPLGPASLGTADSRKDESP